MKRRPAIINNPHIIAIDSYNCIDSGAYFIAAERPKTKLYMQSMNDNSIIEVSRAINGGLNGKEQRIKQSYRAYHVFGDEIEPKYEKEYHSKYIERFTLTIAKQGHEK
jgi:predicted chitinase